MERAGQTGKWRAPLVLVTGGLLFLFGLMGLWIVVPQFGGGWVTACLGVTPFCFISAMFLGLDLPNTRHKAIVPAYAARGALLNTDAGQTDTVVVPTVAALPRGGRVQ